MHLAMKRSRSGLIVRSSVDTAYQLGFDRHAAWVVLSASNVRLNGAWTAQRTRAFSAGTSAAKSRRNASSLSLPQSSDQTMPAEAGGVGYRPDDWGRRSEEHTSELQSHLNIVCRLLLEKKKN